MDNQPHPRDSALPGLDSTAELLALARTGNQAAVDRLLQIFSPLLSRWAHGRLPDSARGLSDTEDLVQITLIRVLGRLETFESKFSGAFLAYLRRSLLNNLRNEIRHEAHRPQGPPLAEELRDPEPSANAARMLVSRGLVRLAELIDKESVSDVQWE